jgi:hypothetical protein
MSISIGHASSLHSTSFYVHGFSPSFPSLSSDYITLLLPVLTISLTERNLDPRSLVTLIIHAFTSIYNSSITKFGHSAVPYSLTVCLHYTTPRLYYKVNWGFGFNFCLALATQITGFGFAGLFRRLLIKPASLIWPQTLVTSTLLNTLHAEEDFQGGVGTFSRYRWFMWVSFGAFIWHWLPGYLFTGLSYFSFICWAAPSEYNIQDDFTHSIFLSIVVAPFYERVYSHEP